MNVTKGITKNKPNIYTNANHLYSAVMFPKHLAIFKGTLLKKGKGYHIRMPCKRFLLKKDLYFKVQKFKTNIFCTFTLFEVNVYLFHIYSESY